VKFLLDEQLHRSAAQALHAFAQLSGDAFAHIYDYDAGGINDDAIPPLCKAQGIGVLVTANFRDFGARKLLYQRLLAAGIHVVVLRPGNIRFLPSKQVSILAAHYERIRRLLADSNGPTMVRVTSTTADEHDLDELIAKIEGGEKRRLP
jgi:predicted nuclease of predicted toxin-antitoxin system